MKQITVVILFSLVAIWLMLAWVSDRRSEVAQASAQGDIQRTFSVRPGGRLVMDVEPGAIEVRSAGESQIAVEVFRRVERAGDSRTEELLREHEVNFDQQGNDLFIRMTFFVCH